MTNYARKKKLINSSLQLKMVFAFLLLASTCALFQVILLNRSLMALAGDMTTDGDTLLAQLPSMLATNLGLTAGVLIPLMFCAGVLITHRIAGPIYRFERHLEGIARGEDMGKCRIRQGDELHDLCAKINAAVEYLQAKSTETSETQADEEAAPMREAA